MFAVSIDSMHLVTDTGLYATDLVTSDPTIDATANGTFSGDLLVEFDHDDDGTADGQVTVYMQGDNFTYDPRVSDASFQSLDGPVTLKYRTIEEDTQNNTTITGDWTSFSFTMEPPSNAEIDVVDEWYVSAPDNIGSVSLGNTQVGTPLSQTFTIYNLGTDDLLLNTDSLTLPSGFSLVTPFDSTVEPNEQTTFTVQLDATSAGNYSGTLSFRSSDADESPFNFTVSGEVFNDLPEIEVRFQFGENIADGTGSADFGVTPPSTNLDRTFYIFNWGNGQLDLDPNSLSLPSGFTLVSPFGTTVGPQGGQTSFTVRLDATNLGNYSGSLSFTTNDADENPFNFTVSGIVADQTTGPITIDYVALVNDTGNRSTDRVTYNPTITGFVNGDFEDGTVEIEFDHDADETPDGSVTVTVSGDDFTYDPRVAETALATFNGTLPLFYRSVWHSADEQTTDEGDWIEFPIELMVDPSVAGLSVDYFGLENDTGDNNSDRFTVRPTIVGVVMGEFEEDGTVRVEFDHDADGVPEGHDIVEYTGHEFVYDPRWNEPALNSYVGNVSITYRLVKLDDEDAEVATGPWSTFRFTLESPQAAREVEEVSLANDTGESNTDGITFDPTLQGTLAYSASTSFYGMALKVEFDLNEDDVPDAQVLANSDYTFQFKPNGLAYGEHTVQVRAREWNEAYQGVVFGEWVPLTFTLVVAPPIGLHSVELQTDTGESDTDEITFDPTLKGKLVGAVGTSEANMYSPAPNVSGVKIQFDHNGNGTVDGQAFTDYSGQFTYRPAGLAAGEVTINARSTRWDRQSNSLILGAWMPFTFTYSPVPLPAVTELKLQSDTGESDADEITQDPTLTGTLAESTLTDLFVEFDHDGDGDADGETTASGTSPFQYVPFGLSPGEHTVHARSTRWDDDAVAYVHGAWTPFTFTLEAAAQTPVAVSSFGLVQDDGEFDDDEITTVSTLKGQLSGGRSVTYVALQFDHDEDGDVDGTATTDDLGKFFYVPVGLGLGEHTVAVRAREWDYAQQQGVTGDWSSFTFTVMAKPNEVPAISAFQIQSDTGEEHDDNITANSLLTGHVTNDGSPARLLIEFDHDGNGTVEGTATTDDEGKFRYRPEPLSYGTVTISARAVEWNEAAGEYQRSAWSDVTFTYEEQTNVAPVLATLGVAPVPSDYYEPLPVSLTGRIINEGDLGQIVIEFDFNDDEEFDATALTDDLGEFNFTPAGLAYGQVTIHARTRELDGITHQLLYSDWTEFAFDNVEPVNQQAVVSTLALTNDTGTGGDLVTTDPSLSGQITNDGNVSGVTIEFDHNSDDVVDGSVQTGATGQFIYVAAGLAAGEHTLRARVKETTSTGGTVLGDWESFTFTLETLPDPTLRVSSLALVEDTGTSSTDKATANPALAGVVSGTEVSGVTVQIDLDNDGQSDETVTTDAIGNFTFTPDDLAEGRHTLRARVAPSASGGYTAQDQSGWKSLTFVYSTDPDGTAAQALVSAFSNFDDDWRLAQEEYDASLSTANNTYRTAYSTAVSAYESTLAAAGALRASVVGAARTAYDAAKTLADSAYAAAIAAAGNTFAVDIGNFTGDTTSYVLPEFLWPDAPPDNALVIPDDAEQPTPPATLSYNFEPYDYNAQPAYQRATTEKEKLRDKQIREAEAAFSNARKAADQAFEAASTEIRDTYSREEGTIYAAFETALQAGVPPVDMEVENLALSARSQQSFEKYQRAVQRSADTYSSIMNAASWGYSASTTGISNYYSLQYMAEYEAFALESSGNPMPDYAGHYARLAAIGLNETTAYANAWYSYNSTMASASYDRAVRDSGYYFTYSTELTGYRQTYDEKQVELNHWLSERRLNAEQVKTEALADKALTRDQDLAEEVRLRDNLIAEADQVRSMSLAEAQIDYRKGVAEAKKALLTTWAASQNTPAASYQLAVATHEVAYLTSLRTKYLLHKQAVSGATLVEAYALHQAEKDQADHLAQADRDRVVERSEALLTLQLASNDADQVRYLAGTGLSELYSVALASADQDYSNASAAAQASHSVDTADAWRDQRIAYAQVEVDFPGPNWSQAEQDAYDAVNIAYRDAMADHYHTNRYAQYAAQAVWDEARSLAIREYRVGYNGEEKTALHTVADAYAVYDIALAAANATRSVEIADALGDFDVAAAVADVGWWQTVAPADEAFDNFEAGFAKTADDGDAAAWSTFQVDTAADFAAAITLWSLEEAGAWRDYQLELALAEVNRVTDQSAADVTQAQALSTARVERVAAEGAANKTYYLAEAAAYKTRVETVVAAMNCFVSATSAARVAEATTLANATTTHDKGVVSKNLVYQNKVATEQEILRNALDDARYGYYRDQADADRDLSKELIDDEEYNDALAAAHSVEREAQAVAEIARANTLAAARATWIHDTGVLRVALAGAKKSAADTLSGVIKAETISLAGTRATAANTLSSTLAEAVRANTVAIATASSDFALEIAPASAEQTTATDEIHSAERKHRALARADYELALYTEHRDKLDAVSSTNATATTAYELAVAEADVARAAAYRDSLETYQDALAASSAEHVASLNIARGEQTLAYHGVGGVELSYAMDLAAAEKDHTIDYDKAHSDRVKAERIAAAGRTDGNAKAESLYQKTLVEARVLLDDDLAAVSVIWVGQMAIIKGELHTSPYDESSWAAFNTAQEGADAVRGAGYREKAAVFAGRVGDAQIKRAEDLGDALVAHAEALGASGVAYTEALVAADLEYEPKLTAAQTAYRADSASADADFSNAVEEAGETARAASALAFVGHNGRLGVAEVVHAGSVAVAESGYHYAVASQLSTQTASWSAGVGTAYAAFKAAEAVARATWTQLVSPAFVEYRTESAQADIDHDARLIAAAHEGADLRSAAQATYADDTSALSAARNDAAFARRRSFDEAQVARDGGQAEAFTVADALRSVAYAEAARQHAIDLATAEKTYQVAYVLIPPGESTMAVTKARTDARANADLNQEIALADADQAWTGLLAEANSILMGAQALAAQGFETDLTTLDKNLAIALAQKQAVLDNGLAAADAYISGLETVAENLWESGMSLVNATLWLGEYASKSTALSGFASTLATPWAGYQASLAMAVTAWWNTAQSDFLSWTADEADAAETFDTSTSAAYVNHTEDVGEAQLTYVSTLAAADQTLRNSRVLAEKTYLVGLVLPTETHLKAQALAKRNHRVAVATATRDLIVGVVNGEAYDAQSQTVALTNANSAKEAALKTAANAYATAEATLRGERFIAHAAANAIYVASVGVAEVANVAETGSADKILALAESAAGELWTVTSAALDVASASSLGQAFSTALGSLSSAVGLPWATFDAAKAEARADNETSVAVAEETLTTEIAEADDDLSGTLAAAAETVYNALSGAAQNWSSAVSAAISTLKSSEATARNGLAAANLYSPELPAAPNETLGLGPYAITPAAAEDYFGSGTLTYDLYWPQGGFERYRDEMFTTGGSDGYWGWGYWGGWWSGYGNYGDNLTERMARGDAPEAGADVRTQAERDGATWQYFTSAVGNTGSFLSSAYSPTMSVVSNVAAAAWDGITHFFMPPKSEPPSTSNSVGLNNLPPHLQYSYVADGDFLNPNGPLAQTVHGDLRAQGVPTLLSRFSGTNKLFSLASEAPKKTYITLANGGIVFIPKYITDEEFRQAEAKEVQKIIADWDYFLARSAYESAVEFYSLHIPDFASLDHVSQEFYAFFIDIWYDDIAEKARLHRDKIQKELDLVRQFEPTTNIFTAGGNVVNYSKFASKHVTKQLENPDPERGTSNIYFTQLAHEPRVYGVGKHTLEPTARDLAQLRTHLRRAERNLWERENPISNILGKSAVVGTAGLYILLTQPAGVGESVDVVILVHPDSSPQDRLLAGTSLAISVVTLTLSPNFGGFGRSVRGVSHLADSGVDIARVDAAVLRAMAQREGLVIIAAAEDGVSSSLASLSTLNRRQLALHEVLSQSGATGRFLKREVAMNDLRALGQVTGDEYSMYTLGGRRHIIRGYGNEIRVTPQMAEDLLAGRYGRWSGHTHPPGYGLEPSSFPFDRAQIPIGQQRSALWGDPTVENRMGITIFHRTPGEDVMFQSERNRRLMRLFYERQ